MSADNVLAWQICTGCANTREVLVTLDEAKRLQALPIAEREQHDGCYPLRAATRSEWVTNGARAVPEYRCNCGQTFPSHLARVAHGAGCPVMAAAIREASQTSAGVDETPNEKPMGTSAQPRPSGASSSSSPSVTPADTSSGAKGQEP